MKIQSIQSQHLGRYQSQTTMGRNQTTPAAIVPALARGKLVARQDARPATDAPPPAAVLAGRVPPLGRVPRWEKGLLVDYYT